MFIVHQIVNALINPILVSCVAMATGLFMLGRGRRRVGWCLSVGGLTFLVLMSWPPLVDATCAWLERDYPMVRAEQYAAADAILVLGGGVGMPSEEVEYPYPTLADAADRVWFGAMLWHEQVKTNAAIKIYCTGPDVGRHTPQVLVSLGVHAAAIRPLDGARNTEEEARRYETELAGKRVLLVTSAMHMKRAMRIFKKYAPSLTVIPAPTDHQYLPEPGMLLKWNYYLPNLNALALAEALQHEIIGLLRYAF